LPLRPHRSPRRKALHCRVSSITLATPQSGDPFGVNETILAFVELDEAVTGAPQLGAVDRHVHSPSNLWQS